MENNIKQYNKDIKLHGTYLYSNTTLSTKIATQRQTKELVNIIKKNFKSKLKILDIGCGDGTFTLELYKCLHPEFLLGIDGAKEAIYAAKKMTPYDSKHNVKFEVGSAYELAKYQKFGFDLVVFRGVLHHLYKPEEAIKSIARLSDSVLILEPNGYNPVLKIIENISDYHRRHEERSFFPFILNKWFSNNGFYTKKQKIFGIVPYFCSDRTAKFLRSIESTIENLPLIRSLLCGSYVALFKKT